MLVSAPNFGVAAKSFIADSDLAFVTYGCIIRIRSQGTVYGVRLGGT